MLLKRKTPPRKFEFLPANLGQDAAVSIVKKGWTQVVQNMGWIIYKKKSNIMSHADLAQNIDRSRFKVLGISRVQCGEC